jgi:hypothetical protein
MTAIQDAIRLLKDAAQELIEGISIKGVPDFAGEPDTAKAYDETMDVVRRLEHIAACAAIKEPSNDTTSAERDYPPLPAPDIYGRDGTIGAEAWGYSEELMHAYYDLGRAARATAEQSSVDQEPVAWRMRNTSYRHIKYEYFRTRDEARLRQAAFNRSVDDGGLHELTPLYLHPAPQQAVPAEITAAVDALISSACLEGGVSEDRVQDARAMTEIRKAALLALIGAHHYTPEDIASARAQGGAHELTDKQIERGWKDTFSTENPFCRCNLKSFTKAVRWAERAARAQAKEGSE